MKKQTLHEHLIELKTGLFYWATSFVIFFILSYYIAEDIYKFLLLPLDSYIQDPNHKYVIYTDLTEVFVSYIKLSLLSSFVMSLPVLLYQLYIFIAPGLRKTERKTLLLLFILSPVLLILSLCFVYKIIIPFAWEFLTSFQYHGNKDSFSLILQAKVSEYLSLVINLFIACGLIFQTPLLIIILVWLGVVEVLWLQKNRKFAVIIIFIIAAVVTPPDVFSQIALAIPLLLLYELSILLCKYVNKNKRK